MAEQPVIRDKVADWMHDLVVPQSKRYQPAQVKPAPKQMATPKPSAGIYTGNTGERKQMEQVDK